MFMLEEIYKAERTIITRLQFTRLIEMCNDLMPGQSFLDTQGENQMYITFRNEFNKRTEAISWFEICILHVPTQLSKRINKRPEELIEIWLYDRSKHLVDYLYDIFKTT